MSRFRVPALTTEKPPTKPAVQHPWTHVWKKRTVNAARWLHIYLSMVSFAILFFFAVTGLTLNHVDWFAHQQRTVQSKAAVNAEWVKGPDVRKLDIVEQLRRVHSIRAALGDFRIDDAQCSLAFKGPGYFADVFIDRSTGQYELTETRSGWGAVINDLHKGRDAGRAWSVLIDASAILMTLVSLTGLALIFFLAKRRTSGLIALAIGAVVCYTIYAIVVP
jgi:hypothetical protein